MSLVSQRMRVGIFILFLLSYFFCFVPITHAIILRPLPRDIEPLSLSYNAATKRATLIFDDFREQSVLRVDYEIYYQWDGENEEYISYGVSGGNGLALSSEIPARKTPGPIGLTVTIDKRNKIPEENKENNSIRLVNPIVDLSLANLREGSGGNYFIDIINTGTLSFPLTLDYPLTVTYRYTQQSGQSQHYTLQVTQSGELLSPGGKKGITLTGVTNPSPTDTITVTVSAPTLTETNLSNNTITETLPIGDLTIVPNMKLVAIDGSPYIEATIKNIGNATIHTGSSGILEGKVGTEYLRQAVVNPGRTIQPGNEITIRLPLYNEYPTQIELIVNRSQSVTERSYQNNTQTFSLPFPDLVVEKVNPQLFNSSMYLPVNVTIKNQTDMPRFNQNRPFTVFYSWKRPDGSIIRSNTKQMNVPSGTNSTTFTIPTNDVSQIGTAQLELKVDTDNVVAESNEDNNIWLSSSAQLPDLLVKDILYKTNSIYTVEIQNIGPATAFFDYQGTNPYTPGRTEYISSQLRIELLDEEQKPVGVTKSEHFPGASSTSLAPQEHIIQEFVLNTIPPQAKFMKVSVSNAVMSDADPTNNTKTVPLIMPTPTPTNTPTPTLTPTPDIPEPASESGQLASPSAQPEDPVGGFFWDQDLIGDVIKPPRLLPIPGLFPCGPSSVVTDVSRAVERVLTRDEEEQLKNAEENTQEDLEALEKSVSTKDNPCFEQILGRYKFGDDVMSDARERIKKQQGLVEDLVERFATEDLARQGKLGDILDKAPIESLDTLTGLRKKAILDATDSLSDLSQDHVKTIMTNTYKDDSLENQFEKLETISILTDNAPGNLTGILKTLETETTDQIKDTIQSNPTILKNTLPTIQGDKATMVTILDTLTHEPNLSDDIKKIIGEEKSIRTKSLMDQAKTQNTASLFQFTDQPTVANLRLFSEISDESDIPQEVKTTLGKAKEDISQTFFKNLENVPDENKKTYITNLNDTYKDATQLNLYKDWKTIESEEIVPIVETFEEDFTNQIKTEARSKRNKTQQEEFLSSFFGFTDEDFSNMEEYSSLFPSDYLGQLEEAAKQIQELTPYLEELQKQMEGFDASQFEQSQESFEEAPIEEYTEPETVEENYGEEYIEEYTPEE